MKRKKIVVMGFMGSMPIAGVIWQHVHYIVGLQRLGHGVFYVEDSARLPYNPETFEVTNEFNYTAQLLDRLAREFGFKNRWGFCARYLPRNPTAGLPLKTIRRLYREADAILNICGTQEFNDDLLVSDRILYIESDPGVEQIKIDNGVKSTIEYLRRHRALFTFGENIGTKVFPVPTHGFKWLPTRQPVVTDLWKTSRAPSSAAVFTSVANWSTSGLKDIRSGWRLRCPLQMSVDYWLYRDYIRRSKGEFTVAKDQYVRLNTGWFSDRSACYLAAGRPVITQETGFTKNYGSRTGLLSFRSLDEIVDAVKAINGDYPKHSRSARILAREFFEAEEVLRSILDRAGI